MASVSEFLSPVLEDLLGGATPLQIRCWDGSVIGPPSRTQIVVRSPHALRRLLYAPNELGLGRAYVAGEIDIDGSVFDVLALRHLLETRRADARPELGARGWFGVLNAARRAGVLGPPLRRPAQEAKLRGTLHSRARDAAAIAHHYNVGNDFYRLILGETMTYSCAYFETKGASLEDAQRAKYDLICRKLGLDAGMRLLDVGCGWGGMVTHAVRNYGVSAVGITISEPQAELAAKRVAESGLSHQIEIRLQDYRDVDDEPYDAISSIGMFEHVGMSRLATYFNRLHALLRPGGRLLNHGISKPSGRPGFDKNSFIARYVFPDGELHEIGRVVSSLQECNLEVRDVESLREHYAQTLRVWVANLEANWDRAVDLAGEERSRIWRLYMAGSAVNFEAGRNSIHQILAVKPHADGRSDMPRARTW